jgi:hypothetical protein
MGRSELDFEDTVADDPRDITSPKSAEERLDQFGVRTALFVLAVAFFIGVMWLINSPSFEKCSALENITERNACFDALRNELLKPPAKGPVIPKS